MIDYEKLRIVHDLANLLCLSSMHYVAISYNFNGKLGVRYELNVPNFECEYSHIDSLIAKLNELTEPEKCNHVYVHITEIPECIKCHLIPEEYNPPKPKYEIGQDVWWLQLGCDICHFKIDAIFFNDVGEWEYDNVPEKELYPSKEALIEAQIEYWQQLKRECCNHNFVPNPTKFIANKICSECGEIEYK